MKSYELAYLISSELSEEEARAFQERIISMVKDQGGTLEDVRNPLRRRLAYSIMKQTQAYLAFFVFKTSPEALADLEKKLKEEKQILRHLIVIKKPVKPIKERVRKIKPQPEGTAAFEENKEYTEKEKKVELEEIEEKLEEILK